jgi:hypothetical protein
MRKTWYAWIPEGTKWHEIEEDDFKFYVQVAEVEHERDHENDATFIYGEYAPKGWAVAPFFGQGLTKAEAMDMAKGRWRVGMAEREPLKRYVF